MGIAGCLAGVAVLWSIVSPGFTQNSANKNPVPNEVPRSWKIEEIDRASAWLGKPGRFYVLAWQISGAGSKEEPRYESCLTLRVADDEDEQGRWVLVRLERLPQAEDSGWHVPKVHKFYGPPKPGKWFWRNVRFKVRPGNKEIYESCTDLGWTFEIAEEVVSCGICERSWQEAIGEKPTRFFGKTAMK